MSGPKAALQERAGALRPDAVVVSLAPVPTLEGAAKAFFDPDRPYEEVADLVPMRPLADAEPQIRKAYSHNLGGLHRKLGGA